MGRPVQAPDAPPVDERQRREINMVLMRYRAMVAEPDTPPAVASLVDQYQRENPTDPDRQLDYIARLSELCTLPEGTVESVRRNLLGVKT